MSSTLTKAQIITALEGAGLSPGSHLLVHSSLRRLGPVDGGAEAVIDALRHCVGAGGTLAMPTFNGARVIAQPYFDVATTPGATGVLTEVFRRQPDVLRSYQPTHSVAACGPRAAEFLRDHHLREAFGIGSPIDRIADAGGWVLLLGVTQSSNSCIHVGESHAGAVKFFWSDGELPLAPVRLPDGTIFPYCVDCSSSCSASFNSMEYPLRLRNAVRDFRVGTALCCLVRCSEVIAATVETIRENPFILTCTNPACRPCRLRRNHLRQSEGRSEWTASPSS
jgi:aminoglycoside 3-N-acetyltransferase